MTEPSTRPVLQLRVALTSRDYERLMRFYCAGLGLEPTQIWTQNGGHGLMLELGQGTLELFDAGYADSIDGLEAGARVSGQVRLALKVPDLQAAPFRFHPIAGGGHNDLAAFPAYWEALDEALGGAATP